MDCFASLAMTVETFLRSRGLSGTAFDLSPDERLFQTIRDQCLEQARLPNVSRLPHSVACLPASSVRQVLLRRPQFSTPILPFILSA
jgi:hypothetical protein